MKKVIFIFLILISSLCFVVISCADKEESSTETTTTASIVDGSAEGYTKIGNILMVWGSVLPDQTSEFSATFPITFLSAPIVTIAHGCTGSCSVKGSFYSVSTTKVTFDAYTTDVMNYIAIGKWQ